MGGCWERGGRVGGAWEVGDLWVEIWFGGVRFEGLRGLRGRVEAGRRGWWGLGGCFKKAMRWFP